MSSNIYKIKFLQNSKIKIKKKSIKSSSFRIFVEKRRQLFVNFTIFLNFQINDIANQINEITQNEQLLLTLKLHQFNDVKITTFSNVHVTFHFFILFFEYKLLWNINVLSSERMHKLMSQFTLRSFRWSFTNFSKLLFLSQIIAR